MKTLSALSVAALLAVAGTAQAAVVHNSGIVGNVIFGAAVPVPGTLALAGLGLLALGAVRRRQA